MWNGVWYVNQVPFKAPGVQFWPLYLDWSSYAALSFSWLIFLCLSYIQHRWTNDSSFWKREKSLSTSQSSDLSPHINLPCFALWLCKGRNKNEHHLNFCSPCSWKCWKNLCHFQVNLLMPYYSWLFLILFIVGNVLDRAPHADRQGFNYRFSTMCPGASDMSPLQQICPGESPSIVFSKNQFLLFLIFYYIVFYVMNFTICISQLPYTSSRFFLWFFSRFLIGIPHLFSITKHFSLYIF